MAKTGRPSKFTKALGERICKEIAKGITLRAIGRDSKFPTRQTIANWLRKDKDFFAQYARAKAIGIDEIAEECLAIADAADETNVQASRLQVDTRKWYVGKAAPKVWGKLREVDELQGDDRSADILRLLTGVEQATEGGA